MKAGRQQLCYLSADPLPALGLKAFRKTPMPSTLVFPLCQLSIFLRIAQASGCCYSSLLRFLVYMAPLSL
ncbi:hypothetical protein MRX96_037566 [Rhipicephalus microplus]